MHFKDFCSYFGKRCLKTADPAPVKSAVKTSNQTGFDNQIQRVFFYINRITEEERKLADHVTVP